MKFKWMKAIKSPEDFPPRFQKLAEDIGVKNALKVIEEFEGETIYFYKIEEGFSHIWHNQIRKKWKKHNIKELAHEYGVTVQTIRNITKDHENQAGRSRPRARNGLWIPVWFLRAILSRKPREKRQKKLKQKRQENKPKPLRNKGLSPVTGFGLVWSAPRGKANQTMKEPVKRP